MNEIDPPPHPPSAPSPATPADAPPPDDPHAVAVPAPETAEPRSERLVHTFAWFLARHGLGPVALSGLAIGLAALAAVLFLLFHPRLGAIAGLFGLAAAELSLVPPRGESLAVPFARALLPAVDLLLMGGLVALASNGDNPISSDAVVLLSLVVLMLVAWLPHLEGEGAPGGGRGLWQRADRMALLLLGALLGSLVPALLIVAVVGGLDTWVRLERIRRPDRSGGPSFLRPLLQPDGSLVPAVRWGSLALAVLVLLLLGPSEGWRF